MTTTTPKGNYKLLINFCAEKIAPSSDFFIIIIAQENKLRIVSLKRIYAGFQITYVCQTIVPLNELIFYNLENKEAFLLLERNNYDKSFIPQALLPRIKVFEWYSFSNVYSLISYNINLNDGYRDRSYHKHSLPIFDGHGISNFEAMIYGTLNTSKIFMGETIAILIPTNDKIYIYIFRRLLLHFLLDSNLTVSSEMEITAASLQYPQRIVKIIDRPFLTVKITQKCQKLKITEALIKNGLEYYKKAEEEKALAVCGTPKYLEAREEAKSKSLLNTVYSPQNISSENVPEKITSSPSSSATSKKTVVIEIKDDSMRVFVMTKISADKWNTIFTYPASTMIFVDCEEYIPMYISFLRQTAIIGKQALKDYKNNPDFVVFDILKVAGKCLSNPPKINKKCGFQLVPLNDSPSAKFGFKVQTFDGIKVIPVEILLSMLFRYLLNMTSDYIESKEFTLRFLQKKLSSAEKNVIWAVSKTLKRSMKLECFNQPL